MNNNLRAIRKQKGIGQVELAKELGIGQSSYSRYEAGITNIPMDILSKLADIFGVSTDVILAVNTKTEVPIQQLDPDDPRFAPKVLIRQPLPDPEKENALIPILGSVRAGYDYIAEQEMLGWLKVEDSFASAHPQAFSLYVKGDSMSPEIRHNDIAVCLPDQEIHSNDVAVVCVNGDEGTVKRVRFDDDGLTLLPANPRYKPHHYSAEDVRSLPVVLRAKVIEVRHQYN